MSSSRRCGSLPAIADSRRPLRRTPRVAQPLPDARLVEGIERYNHHQFFECHEVVEQLWLETDGPLKDFYKGVIQAAVACYHWSRGNLLGALTLARSSTAYLRRYRPVCCRIDVERFVEEFSGLFTWLRRHRQRYDERLVPVIRWASSPRARGAR